VIRVNINVDLSQHRGPVEVGSILAGGDFGVGVPYNIEFVRYKLNIIIYYW